MSIFKNDNEILYKDGRKHFTDVIKNQALPDQFFYRAVEEDFNTNSTLIVMPGEVAYFIKGGEIVNKFTNGTYKLSTKNYPFLSRLVNMFSGGVSKFNCIICFVRIGVSTEFLWGTSSPIVLRDKVLHIATKIKCRGAYKVAIEDDDKFLGTYINRNVQWASIYHIEDFLGETFEGKIRDRIANYITNNFDSELLEISSKAEEIANGIKPILAQELEPFGLNLASFTITALDVEDSELRRQYDQIGMDVYKTRMEAAAQKATFDILGDNWSKQQQAEIMKTAAANEGSGGIGVGLATAVMTGKELFNNNESVSPKEAKKDDSDDVVTKLKKLKSLFENELISKEEYDEKRKELLAKL